MIDGVVFLTGFLPGGSISSSLTLQMFRDGITCDGCFAHHSLSFRSFPFTPALRYVLGSTPTGIFEGGCRTLTHGSLYCFYSNPSKTKTDCFSSCSGLLKDTTGTYNPLLYLGTALGTVAAAVIAGVVCRSPRSRVRAANSVKNDRAKGDNRFIRTDVKETGFVEPKPMCTRF